MEKLPDSRAEITSDPRATPFPRSHKRPHKDVELARYSFKQAVLVALIAAIGGVITTLISSSVLRQTGDSTADQRLQLQAKVTKLEADLRASVEALDREAKSTKTLESRLAASEKELQLAREANKAPPPPSPLRNKGVSIYFADSRAPDTVKLRKVLESAGAKVRLIAAAENHSPFLMERKVYYDKNGDMEAAVQVRAFLMQLGIAGSWHVYQGSAHFADGVHIVLGLVR